MFFQKAIEYKFVKNKSQLQRICVWIDGRFGNTTLIGVTHKNVYYYIKIKRHKHSNKIVIKI